MSEKRILTCHCGAVEIEVQFDNELENICRCDCSLCKRKGAVMAAIPVTHLKVIKGRDNLTLYQWNTKIAEHYFCKTCGIYTHHKRRSNPNEYGDIPIGNGNLNASLPELQENLNANN